jgi:membrane-associated phospholipid phosphatase
MVGIGGLAGLIGYMIVHMQINLEFYLILTILAAGLVGTARLILGAHKPFEIYTGFLIGCVVVTSAIIII